MGEGNLGILSGCRVLDLSDEKGMFCAKVLADMGAEVTRAEKHGACYAISDTDYTYLNAVKKRITLDLDTAAGKQDLKRLVKTTDVLIETEQPGKMESMGLGYAALRKINPRLIMASITDFGQGGHYKDLKSSDLVAQAMGGWMSVTGEADGPLKLYGSQAYYTASLFAANGVMLALWDRHTTGRGQHIDISVMECVAATLDHALVRYAYEGVVSERKGSRHWNDAFRVFSCKDGYILLSLFQNWETLVEWLDSEGMAEDLTDKKWRDREEQGRGIDHVIEALEKWTLTHTVGELVEKGQLMHFPWGEVATIPKLLESPQLKERGFFTELVYRGKRGRAPGIPLITDT
jgi:crotonobetainyl-CoA:carnitine CoA-transferase CaiB-like acyl-CoA transferase